MTLGVDGEMANQRIELQRAREALGSGDANAAARICQRLLTDNPRDQDARYLHGRSLAALSRWPDAANEFRRVLSAPGGSLAAMIDLGIAEAFAGNHREAMSVLEQARALDPRPAELHFALGLCRLGIGDNAGAADALREAIALNGDFPDAHNNLGVAYDRLGRLPEAVACFRRAVEIHSEFADAQRNLGFALLAQGDATQAIAAFQMAAGLRPQDASAFAELGAAQLAAADYVAAAASLERAVRIDRGQARAAANWGAALWYLGRREAAASALRQALDIDPTLAEAHLGLGRIAAARDDVAAALTHLAAAAPGARADARIACALALEWEPLGLRAEALSLLQDTVRERPRDAETHAVLGGVLHRSGRLPEAIDCYERALEIDDRRADTHQSCGHALETLGALRRALGCFERVLELRPGDARAIASIVGCAFRLCDWQLADDRLAILRERPGGLDALHPFAMLAADLGAAGLAESLRRRSRPHAASVHAPPVAPPVAPPLAPRHTSSHASSPRGSHERLRIAYVSPDFRAHPVAYAIAGVIEQHDRGRIAPIGISLSAADGSEIGARLKGAFEETIDASSLSDRDVVRIMREREIDIAIDLAGLTVGARTGIFERRAAPIQVNFLGFPASMGLECMDFIIADGVVVPPDEERCYTEKVARLPHCYLPFDASRGVAAPAVGREAFQLPTDGFVFCAFTNGYKITRAVFEVWIDLLREIPSSVLWLRNMGADTSAQLKRTARQQGIAADRLVFAPFVESMDAHLSRLQLADVFLDTVPYNAHTTAAEALWAGVPVLTCRGRSFAGRVGASLLSACGLPELICEDIEDYRSRALGFARAPESLLELRRQLRERKATAPVFDTRRYVRDLEQLLLEMHRGGVAASREASASSDSADARAPQINP
jgi:protein O-GlcNAc transferase